MKRGRTDYNLICFAIGAVSQSRHRAVMIYKLIPVSLTKCPGCSGVSAVIRPVTVAAAHCGPGLLSIVELQKLIGCKDITRKLPGCWPPQSQQSVRATWPHTCLRCERK